MTSTSVARHLAAAGCVYADEEAAILAEAADTTEQLDAMVARRTAGEPLEYVVGWTDFHGIRLTVTKGVFVPRVRSDFLVQQAASLVRCSSAHGRNPVVVDLCCGVGAIGAAVAREVPGIDLHAADIDARAVACAEQNLLPVGGRVHHGDLFSALPRRLRRRTDVVVASPPYVPTAEIGLLPPEAREHEPPVALDGGADGLTVVRRIAREARQWLAVAGCLALEVGDTHPGPVVDLFERLGWSTRAITSQEYGSAVVIGRRTR